MHVEEEWDTSGHLLNAESPSGFSQVLFSVPMTLGHYATLLTQMHFVAKTLVLSRKLAFPYCLLERWPWVGPWPCLKQNDDLACNSSNGSLSTLGPADLHYNNNKYKKQFKDEYHFHVLKYTITASKTKESLLLVFWSLGHDDITV